MREKGHERANGPTVHRGQDRRSRQTGPAPALAPGGLLRQAVLLPLGVMVPLAVVSTRGASAASVAGAVEVLSALAAVIAGVALLVSWKMSGRAVAGWLGVALLDLGLLSVAYHSLSALSPVAVGATEPFGRAVVAIVVVATVVAAVRSPEIDSSFRPVRALGVTAAAGLGVLMLLDRVAAAHPAIETTRALTSATTGFCAALWIGLAGYVLARRDRTAEPHAPWVATFAALRASGAVVAAVLPASGWAVVAAQLILLLAAAVALMAGASTLQWRVQGQDRYAYDLRTVLERLRSDVEAERAELEERLHDLRNAVAAMRTADSTLRRFDGRLDESTRVALADALTSELSRLQTLIEPGRRARMQDFCLAATLAPVLATERTLGSKVEVALEPAAVHGDPDGLAQVVRNLLVNARLYAPGAPVRLAAERIADRVILHVADQGPGVPESERATIFGRGYRGSTSEGTGGSGLGLFVAARLMAEMGGSLHLADSPGGARFVVELQAARTAAATGEPSPPALVGVHQPG